MKFVSVDGYNFIDENTYMKNMFKNSRTIKVGAEYRLTDNFSVRGGYAYTCSLTENIAQQILSSTILISTPLMAGPMEPGLQVMSGLLKAQTGDASVNP